MEDKKKKKEEEIRKENQKISIIINKLFKEAKEKLNKN